MKRLACSLLLLLAMACGGGDSTAPSPTFPAVAGNYTVSGHFDGFTDQEASFTGTLLLTQASREAAAIGGTTNFTVNVGGQIGTNTIPITLGSVTPDGAVSFRIDRNGATWTFTGTASATAITGRHSLADATGSISGNWEAHK